MLPCCSIFIGSRNDGSFLFQNLHSGINCVSAEIREIFMIGGRPYVLGIMKPSQGVLSVYLPAGYSLWWCNSKRIFHTASFWLFVVSQSVLLLKWPSLSCLLMVSRTILLFQVSVTECLCTLVHCCFVDLYCGSFCPLTPSDITPARHKLPDGGHDSASWAGGLHCHCQEYDNESWEAERQFAGVDVDSFWPLPISSTALSTGLSAALGMLPQGPRQPSLASGICMMCLHRVCRRCCWLTKFSDTRSKCGSSSPSVQQHGLSSLKLSGTSVVQQNR